MRDHLVVGCDSMKFCTVVQIQVPQQIYMKNYNKLVRDKIPAILDKKKIPYEKRIASPNEYKVELIKKLKEEVNEFIKAGDPEELADVIEVVEALKKLSPYTNVEKLRRNKLKEKGAFAKRIILKGKKG